MRWLRSRGWSPAGDPAEQSTLWDSPRPLSGLPGRHSLFCPLLPHRGTSRSREPSQDLMSQPEVALPITV